MLKIRTLIIALAFAPLISFGLILSNQAQTNSPSRGTAGSVSGGGNTGSNNTPISSPSRGTAGSVSGGGNTGSNNTPGSSPSRGVAGSVSGATPNVLVTRAADGTINIQLSQTAARSLNLAVNSLISSGRADVFLSVNTTRLQLSLITSGLSPQLAKEFTSAASQIINYSSSSGTSGFPSVQLPTGQLVATTKALKPSSSIAQANEQPTVNVNNLHTAINSYNKIVLESNAATLQKLSRNSDFVKVGKALSTLRTAIN